MLIEFLRKKAIAVTESREPDVKIGGRNDPYMLRWWWLPRNRFLNVYIHRFLRDDEDRALHDHPWWSFSILCQGFIREFYTAWFQDGTSYTAIRDLVPGDTVFRKATFSHRIVVMPDRRLPLTIFITGPKIREWGFHCEKGWRHWMDFVDMEDTGSTGRGCGEMDVSEQIHCRKCGKAHHKINYDSICSRCDS